MNSQNQLKDLHRRMPSNFGPFPGPRQSFDGLRRNGSDSTNVEAFITFKTTQAALLDLMPPGFSFQKATGDAYVSIAPKQLDKLEWLGGRGYNLLSFYIHGVKYVAPDGKEYMGTFLPVLWEDMADPIISGREELGFPKVFADIAINATGDSYHMAASWQGSQFAHFKLQNLRETEATGALAPAEAGVDDGIFLYRYIPTVGKPGIAEAEYPVFVSHKEERKMQAITTIKKFVTTEGSFKWLPLDWQALPTLHHIVSRLATIPMLEIKACGMTEKIGWADLSTARRVGQGRAKL